GVDGYGIGDDRAGDEALAHPRAVDIGAPDRPAKPTEGIDGPEDMPPAGRCGASRPARRRGRGGRRRGGPARYHPPPDRPGGGAPRRRGGVQAAAWVARRTVFAGFGGDGFTHGAVGRPAVGEAGSGALAVTVAAGRPVQGRLPSAPPPVPPVPSA